jgi:cell division protein FtsQ
VTVLRRRSKPSPLARLRRFWLLIVAALMVTLAAGYVLASRPELRVHSITVTGNRVVDQRTIVGAAAIPLEANAWLLDTKGIARRVEAIPYVGSAHVHRHPLADIELNVTERVPSACAVAGDEGYAIDAQLRVLQTGCAAALPRYVVVLPNPPKPGEFLSQESAGRLRDDAAVLESAGVAVRQLSFDRFGSLDAVATNGLLLQMGDDADLANKARLIGPILESTRKRLRAISGIDLRAPSTPVVTYK